WSRTEVTRGESQDTGPPARAAVSRTNEPVQSGYRPRTTPRRVVPRRRRDAVVRRGLRHVGRAIAGQPGMFALALLGSSLYAAMTVASAYVIGAVTEHVVLPAFAQGRTTGAALALAAVAIIGVAV